MKKHIIILILLLSAWLYADFNFAEELFEDGLYEEAINEFQAIVQLYPTSYEAERSLFYIGRSHKQMQNYNLAEATFRQLLDGYPQNSFQDEIYFSLAEVQYEQKKYNEAITNYQYLIRNFPLSESAKNSLENYLDCFFQLKDFEQVINKGTGLQQDYKASESLDDILLLQVRAYLNLNSLEEAETLMNLILTEYPEQNASREVKLLKADMLSEEGKFQAAEEQLIASLNNLPRNYEEVFRFKLAMIYLKAADFPRAVEQLEILTEKFNNSSDLDKFMLYRNKANLGLANYNEVIILPEELKVIQNSELYPDFLLTRAEAFFQLGKLNEAEELIKQILSLSDKPEINFQAQMLQARILEDKGRWVQAIKQYDQLVDSPFARKDQIWLRSGNIYSNKLGDHNKAIRYYNNIIYGVFSPQVQYEAFYLLAVSQERLENYQAAVAALNNIDPDEIKDRDFRTRLRNKLNFLKKYKLQDYDAAFQKLLKSVYSYLETSKKQELQNSIVDILSNDLKEYQLANQILVNSAGQEDLYVKALLNLALAEKEMYQKNTGQADAYLETALDLASRLDVTRYEEEIREISLREQVLRSEDQAAIVANLENFINQYPASPVREEFLILIIDHYRDSDDPEKMVQYIELLDLSGKIDPQLFYKNKLWLAEYYYSKNNDEKARENFHLAEVYLDLNRPDNLFHYAVTLDQTGEQEAAVRKLEFLVNNTEGFKNHRTAVDYLVKLLIDKEAYSAAAKYHSYITEADRNDDYYRRSADIFLALNDKQAAQEAIMHIVEKDNSILEKLAYLQYETGDLEMAKYSFDLLKDRDSGNLDHYEMLGRIAFEQEKYLEAAENFKVVVDALGEEPSAEAGLGKLARENIIALYHIGNRPKAEALLKRFQPNLTEQDEAQINLHEGIYFLEMDAKKAEKVFTKLTKSTEVDNYIRYEAYFWRGISHLQQEDMDAAEADFLVVLESGEQQLINQANLKLGTLNFSRENYQRSLEHYFEVIENDETGDLALDAAKNFAFVCKSIEEWQKAVAAYEIILERWGDSGLEATTLFDIAFCHFRDKRYPDALKMFREALPILSDRELTAEAQYWIGEALFNMADYDKAIAEFLKVSYNYGDLVHWSATAELKAGEAYTKAEQPDKAIRIYERIIAKYGEISQWGKEAQFRIANLQQDN